MRHGRSLKPVTSPRGCWRALSCFRADSAGQPAGRRPAGRVAAPRTEAAAERDRDPRTGHAACPAATAERSTQRGSGQGSCGGASPPRSTTPRPRSAARPPGRRFACSSRRLSSSSARSTSSPRLARLYAMRTRVASRTNSAMLTPACAASRPNSVNTGSLNGTLTVCCATGFVSAGDGHGCSTLDGWLARARISAQSCASLRFVERYRSGPDEGRVARERPC